MLPPHRVVSFTSQQRGASLVDEIARVMREGGEASQADPQAAAQEVTTAGWPVHKRRTC